MPNQSPNAKVGHLSRNGLQVVAALVRMEARNFKQSDDKQNCPLEELADRLDTIILTHKQIDPDGNDYTVPLDACMRAVIREKCEVSQTQDAHITAHLNTVRLSLDKAVPVMLLFAEVLSVIETNQKDLGLKNVTLSRLSDKNLLITLQLSQIIEGFENKLGHQMIALIEKQLGAKISHDDETIKITFDL